MENKYQIVIAWTVQFLINFVVATHKARTAVCNVTNTIIMSYNFSWLIVDFKLYINQPININ